MLTRNIITIAIASSMLASCAFFERKPNEEPNHSWKPEVNYYGLGGEAATLATAAFSKGDFKEAEEHVIDSLTINPKQPQALMVGALLYEQTGRINRARQYYEDLILIGGDQMSVLGSANGTPEKVTDIAKRRLRNITLKQSEIVIEEKDGTKVFNVSNETSQAKGKSAMEEALFVREQKLIAQNKASSEADVKAVEILFSDQEKNIISRFLILKELAEKDMITKEEFLAARMANVGGLLPLTNVPPAYGIDKPVPSADLIVDRINALREATETRAITPREFSSERDLIVEAILPPRPRMRIKPKAPARDIMAAAKEIRKLEVIYDLNLITSKEKDKEKQAIERALGMNKDFASIDDDRTPDERLKEERKIAEGMASSKVLLVEPAQKKSVIPSSRPNVSDPFLEYDREVK